MQQNTEIKSVSKSYYHEKEALVKPGSQPIRQEARLLELWEIKPLYIVCRTRVSLAHLARGSAIRSLERSEITS